MAKTVEAVFENGVFRPLTPVDYPEGQRVHVYMYGPESVVSLEQMEEEMRKIQDAFAEWSDEDWSEFEQTFKRD